MLNWQTGKLFTCQSGRAILSSCQHSVRVCTDMYLCQRVVSLSLYVFIILVSAVVLSLSGSNLPLPYDVESYFFCFWLLIYLACETSM